MNLFCNNSVKPIVLPLTCQTEFTFYREIVIQTANQQNKEEAKRGAYTPPGGRRQNSHSLKLAGVSKPDLSQQMGHNTSGPWNVGKGRELCLK